MNLSQAKDVAIVGALIAAGYYVWKATSAVPEALANTGAAVATGFADFKDAIYSYFGGQPVGETLFYTVFFTNGAHSVPASTVDSAGRFTFRGAKFVMRFQPKVGGAKGEGKWWAFKS